MKLTLKNLLGQFGSVDLLNSNFSDIETELQDKVLYRNNPDGEPNQMENDLDMNSFSILNIKAATEDSEILTKGRGDTLYLNVQGDSMEGELNLDSNTLTGVPDGQNSSDAVNKRQLDTEAQNRLNSDSVLQSNINSEEQSRQDADANLQDQISGTDPLEASAFSEISWHDQEVSNSVTIPDNKNAWSIGPEMAIASGQQVTIGSGSFWTIVEGALV